MLNIFKRVTTRDVRHSSVDDVYDEDFSDTRVILGLFKFIRRYTLRQSKQAPTFRSTTIPGFRRASGGASE